MTSPRQENIVIDALCQSLFDEIGWGLYVLDAEGRFIYASPAFERITGLGGAVVAGSHLSEVVVPDGGGPAEPGAGSSMRVALLRNGVPEPGYSVINSRVEGSGGAHRVGIIGRAPASPTEAEETIRLFTIAVEQSPATVVITDRDGSIEYVNPKFTQLTGYTLAEAKGRNPRILKSGEQPQEFYAGMWEVISSGREWRGEFHNIKKNGESYWESASISPVMNVKGEIAHYIAVKEDITERKKAEDAVRASEERLRAVNSQMEKDLLHAQAVVGSLLPSSPPQVEGLMVDFRYLPMDAIGGDFFSFNTLHDRGFGVFIGDVVGHGVSAALFLSLVRSFAERLNLTQGTDPARYIKELNDDLVEWRVVLFLTALYGYFDFSGANTLFRFAKGGHTPPVLYDHATGTARSLFNEGRPLGLVPDSVFPEAAVPLRKGDRIYLYTDGVIEARDPNNILFGTEGLESLIEGTGGMDLGSSLDHILQKIDEYSRSARIEDDAVIIGFEVLT